MWANVFGALGLVFALLVVLHFLLKPDMGGGTRTDESRLTPLASYIVSFRDTHGRLPTVEEVKDWASKTHKDESVIYYPNQPAYPYNHGFLAEWGVSGRDFVVGIWRGDTGRYYRSWDEKIYYDP